MENGVFAHATHETADITLISVTLGSRLQKYWFKESDLVITLVSLYDADYCKLIHNVVRLLFQRTVPMM